MKRMVIGAVAALLMLPGAFAQTGSPDELAARQVQRRAVEAMIWAMPAIYVGEYQFGCWILNRPVAQRVHFRQFRLRDYAHWHVFSQVVWPTFWPAFVGSLFVAIPSAIFIYFLMRLLISRARTPQKAY